MRSTTDIFGQEDITVKVGNVNEETIKTNLGEQYERDRWKVILRSNRESLLSGNQ